jgi:hypothetical protein
MTPDSPALGPTRKVLKVLKVLNWFYGGAILALLIASFAEPEWFFRAIGVKPGGDSGTIAGGMRAMAALGVATIPINVAILDRLIAMVDTVRAGDPFVTGNAVRLRQVAWCVLGLEVIHLAIGAIIRMLRATAQHIDMDWSFSLTPLIAVLLIFVLANVFEHGARMRADLEGTV